MEEITLKAAFGETEKVVILSQQRGGTVWHIYIDKFVNGRIIKHDTGWAIYLDTKDLTQGDADALLDVIGIPVEERHFKKGYRNPLWPDWYIKELDILGL